MTDIVPRPSASIVSAKGAPERLREALQALWNALESPESRRSYRADWERYCAWLAGVGETPVTARPITVQQYMGAMLEAGRAKSTRARALAVLRRVYAALVIAEVVPMNPAREVANVRVAQEPRTPWLTPEELRAMLAPWGEDWRARRDRLVLVTLVATGLRRKEVARLSTKDLELGGKALRARGKGGKEAVIALPGYLSEMFAKWAADQSDPAGPLFPHAQFADGHSISGATVHRIVKDAAKRAGIDPHRATPHAIRRSFATIARERGVSRDDVQAAMLHTKSATTELYDKGARLARTAPGEALADIVQKKSE